MRNETLIHATRRTLAAAVVAGTTFGANADVITDWNTRADDIIAASKLGTPPAFRVMAVVQTAVHDAVNAVTRLGAGAPAEAAVAAAVAAANRATLASLVPSQAASIDAMYRAALATVVDGARKDAGIAAGEQAAAAVLAARADGAAVAETYRPHTTAGLYVPTLVPAASQWPMRKPWLMASADQFRPGPPPALTSALWARDFNEMKEVGGKVSARRSPEQSEIARFWQASLPSVYNGVVRSLASAPGRSVAGNARLFATVAQATDDALIAIMDAKYHYNFWRPVTAIRNGDIDGNDATQRDQSWAPFIDTPMHPEYPCAHCVLSGAVGTVLKAEIGHGLMPALTSTSHTAQGASRSWSNVDDFMTEVANARVYGGLHYRNSTEVGAAIGKQVGQLAAAKHLPPLARLSPGENEALAMIVPAKGVQIYECRPVKGRVAAYEWAFVAPEADLFDAHGRKIGRHYAGPHWESSDGSRVVATVKQREDALIDGAVPWLLMTAKVVVPHGAFGKVTSIQRLNTVGGTAPAQGCTSATAGKRARIGYTADYHFFAAGPVAS